MRKSEHRHQCEQHGCLLRKGHHGVCVSVRPHAEEIRHMTWQFMNDDDYFDRWQEKMEREQSARDASSSGGSCW